MAIKDIASPSLLSRSTPQDSERRYAYLVDCPALDSVESVIEQLKRVGEHLPGTELADLVLFNQAYIVVSEEVRTVLMIGEFEHPDLVEKLDVAFARYYFEALNRFAATGALPRAWQAVAGPRAQASTRLLLGASAHINHDLPLAISESIEDPAGFARDFARAERIIARSVDRTLELYYQSRSRFSFVRWLLRAACRRPATALVLHWRRQAWRNARSLSSGTLTVHSLARRNLRIANRIVRFDSWTAGPRRR